MTRSPDEMILIGSVVVIGMAVVAMIIREMFKVECAPSIDRFGYVKGHPKSVCCSRCQSEAKLIGYFTKDDEPWTEWGCPRCFGI